MNSSSTSTPAIPNEWLCPITLSIMRDPVIATDGHSYERSAMDEWFARGNRRSPKTNEVLASYDLIPNHGLRNTIEHYFQMNPLALHATATMTKAFEDSAVAVRGTRHGDMLHVEVQAASASRRQPIVVIAIVDHSGSMGELAEPSDAAESYGYTRQDLVGHGLNTLAAILGPDDMLAIVKFSTGANIVMRPTRMDDRGKAEVKGAVATIRPEGQTNIFEGCRLAMDIANQDDLQGRHIVGLLLTDGFPNVNPPRGILQTLRMLPMKNSFKLSTFGFGYKLDSLLLTELAEWGGGIFGFIPDCTMVGTVLINYLANMLAVGARSMTIKAGNSEIVTGAIPCGQTRNYVVPLRGEAPSVLSWAGGSIDIVEGDICEFAVAQNAYCSALLKAMDYATQQPPRLELASQVLMDFYEGYKTSQVSEVRDLLRDVKSKVDSEGQVSMAFDPRYFDKWGAHYVRAYTQAQLREMCMNFKDPGLQLYGGELFHDIQAQGDKAFISIPPPTPSGQKQVAPSNTIYGTASAVMSAPVSMASWHNQSGGCFHGDCLITMGDGTRTLVRDVIAGNEVATPYGPTKVRAVVVCNTQLSSQPMVHLENLCITPWHPIRIAGEWVHPASIAPYVSRPVRTVFNFVLEDHHIVYVEGYQCCTLAHGIEGPVIGHEFFGTEKVIRALERCPGWDVGRPTFVNLTTVRDVDTRMIVDWIDQPL